MVSIWKAMPLEHYNRLMHEEEEEESVIVKNNNEALLDYIPKRYREKCEKILKVLENSQIFKWNSDGVIEYKGDIIANSHIADLLLTAVRPFASKNSNPPGLNEFIRTIVDLNVPKALLSSPFIKQLNENSTITQSHMKTFRSMYNLRNV